MNALRKSLSKALQWESAHVGLEKATEGLDLKSISTTVEGLPYSIWQLVEHIRIAQKDILEFSKGNDYIPIQWPEDYWPEESGPDNIKEWERSLQDIFEERQEMVELVEDTERDLFKTFPHGDGQHLFREVMLIIDHEAYHTGQIVSIRKIMGNWA